LDNWFRDENDGTRPWLFPQLVRITNRWVTECVIPNLKDYAYPQMLLLTEYSHAAAERIYRAIVSGTRGEKRLVPTLRPFESIGSTDDVWFATTRKVFPATRSHLNYVVLDSSWEAMLAKTLEDMNEVVAYVKNHGLNFKIPYAYEGRASNYVPDYVIRLDDASSTGPDDLLTLVLEVSGEAKKEKQAKVATTTDLWVPAVNNWGGLGRWGFIEITDPWSAETLIRKTFLTKDGVREQVSGA
jgi:type III restriction enzyme